MHHLWFRLTEAKWTFENVQYISFPSGFGSGADEPQDAPLNAKPLNVVRHFGKICSCNSVWSYPVNGTTENESGY
jgi:hypothetical protein